MKRKKLFSALAAFGLAAGLTAPVLSASAAQAVDIRPTAATSCTQLPAPARVTYLVGQAPYKATTKCYSGVTDVTIPGVINIRAGARDLTVTIKGTGSYSIKKGESHEFGGVTVTRIAVN